MKLTEDNFYFDSGDQATNSKVLGVSLRYSIKEGKSLEDYHKEYKQLKQQILEDQEKVETFDEFKKILDKVLDKLSKTQNENKQLKESNDKLVKKLSDEIAYSYQHKEKLGKIKELNDIKIQSAELKEILGDKIRNRETIRRITWD